VDHGAEIEWRNMAALGALLEALTRGARTEAKANAYETIRRHVNAASGMDLVTEFRQA
jgi:hypothetical protein